MFPKWISAENVVFDRTHSLDRTRVNILHLLRLAVATHREYLLVGIAALAVYLPGIWWGLPYATHPLGIHSWEIDAVTGMQTLSELHNLLIEPKADWYLAYPPFHYLVLGALYAPYFLMLYLTGGISQLSAVYPFGFTDPVATLRDLTLIGRALNVLMAAAVVANAYAIARTVWDARTARLTAAAAALPATMVFYARTGNLEIPMLFWTSVTLLVLARCFTYGFTTGRAGLLGLFAAIAVGTKDQAYGALAIGLAALVVVHLLGKSRLDGETPRWKAPLILFISGVIAYAFTSGFVFSPHRFFAHIEFVRNFDQTFYNVIHLGLLRPATPLGYATLTGDILTEFIYAVGPIFLVTGIAGAAIAWRSCTFAKVLAVILAGYMFLVIFPIRHMQFRYIIVPAFLLAFFIGRALAVGLQNDRKWLRAAVLLVAIAGFGWLGLRAVELTYEMVFDARYEAGEWLAKNAEPGDKIAFFSVQNVIPSLHTNIVPVHLLAETSAVERLQSEKIRFVLVQQDWSSPAGSDRGYFFPDSVYEAVTDGSLGYREAAAFETRPLFRGFFLDAPLVSPGYIVNPKVKIFELNEGSLSIR